MSTENILQLKPEQIEPGENAVRYGLQANLDSLKLSIKELGGVTVPLEVEAIDPSVRKNGKTHRLLAGFRRFQSVTELNAEEGAGLTLPCILARDLPDDIARLKHQLVENVERQSMSPMDCAVAVQNALARGMTRTQVRELFRRQRPGAKKGQDEVKAVSTAWISIHLALLELPKTIQEKIHRGMIGVAAAYELTRVEPGKRAAVLERAERETEVFYEREAKDEERYTKLEAGLEEATQEQATVTQTVEGAKAELTEAEKALDAKEAELKQANRDLVTIKKQKGGKDAVKQAKEAVSALEADVKGMNKRAEELTKVIEKGETQQQKTAKLAAELKAKLEETRLLRKKAKKPAGVTKEGVAKAAQAEGSGQAVPLKLAEIRKVLEELSGMKAMPMVQGMAIAIQKCFEGVTTPGMMLTELSAVTHEQMPKKAVKEEAPAAAKKAS